jgi:copper chaperone CopZ
MGVRSIVPAMAFLFALLPSVSAADEKSERFTFRVIGLFSPDREQDLREAFKELPELTLVTVNFDDAEITVEFVPAKAFPGVKAEQIVERLDQQLRSVTRHTFGAKPRRTVARDKLQQVVIPAAGLDCKACSLAAYEAVAAIEGVVQATASFKEGKVTALFDPAKTDRAKLEDALRKKGVQLGKP